MQRVQVVRNALTRNYTRAREMPTLAAKQIESTIKNVKVSLESAINNGKIWIYQIILMTLTAAILMYASIFMYASFYFSFIPVVGHEAPLHLGFEPCFQTPEKCGFINASLSLNMLSGSGNQDEINENNSPVLMAGQRYAVVVALNMPESPKNLDLGMFMSCLQMRSTHQYKPTEGGIIIRSTCKSSILQYRSLLLRIIETFAFAPLYMSGHMVEKQTVYIEFFESFTDNPLNPAVTVDFQLQSRFAEVYNARLIIRAKFVGLRYFMYYYPVTSAIVGTLFNFHVLAFVVLLSWLRFSAPSRYTDETDEYKNDVDNELDESLFNEYKTKYNQDNTDEERDASSDLVVIQEDNANQMDSEEDIVLKGHLNYDDSKGDKKTK